MWISEFYSVPCGRDKVFNKTYYGFLFNSSLNIKKMEGSAIWLLEDCVVLICKYSIPKLKPSNNTDVL